MLCQSMVLPFARDITKSHSLIFRVNFDILQNKGEFMNKELHCYADDVTGALDVAGSFYSRGYQATVLIDQDFLDIPQSPCLVTNLNSRYDSPIKSAEKLSEAIGRTDLKGEVSIFLKVDSTLRGNVLSDSRVLGQLVKEKPVFIAPSFPFYGRICVNGVFLVKNQPILETEFADDKAFHYSSSLLNDYEQDIEHIDWRVLDKGVDAIVARVDSSSTNRFTFDTRNQTDLELIVDAGLSIEASLVGSSGLARALPKGVLPQATYNVDNSMPALFVVGSIHQISRMQKDELVRSGVFGVELSHQDIGNARALQDIKEATQEGLEREGIVYIATPKEITNDEILWHEIEASIAQAAQIQDVRHNLVLVGGETAKAVLGGRDIKTLEIRLEYESGIPISTEPQKTDALLTKAGGFGHSNTLVDIRRFIHF